jgi:uncharacterized protein YndB with AHSA1/START domain
VTEHATLRTIDGKPVLRFERRLRHSPAKVWRAVSDPAELAHWFPAAVEAELTPGAPMRFTFPEEAVVDGAWDGEVLEVDPPKVYMFRWSQDVLRFELLPDGDGCRLIFTQTIGGGRIGELGAGRTATGWDTCLAALTGLLDGVPVAPREDWLTPMEGYIEEFGLGFGTATPTELHFARDLVWKPPAEVWPLLSDATIETAPPGRVLSTNAPHELGYEWLHEGEPAGRVTWRIESDDQLGVRVELTQTVPSRLADLRARLLAEWHVRLELLFAATQGKARPWPADRVAELTKHYADDEFRGGAGSTSRSKT